MSEPRSDSLGPSGSAAKLRSIWRRHGNTTSKISSLDSDVREDVVVGEAELSTGVAKVAGAGVAKVAGVTLRAGEESTSTGVVKVAGVGADEKLMSASVAAIADKVLVAMDALSASMLACHALQNTATNEQHNPACSRPCTKP